MLDRGWRRSNCWRRSTLLSEDVMAIFYKGCVHDGIMFGVAGFVVFHVTGILRDSVADFLGNLSGLGVALGKVVNYAVGIRNLYGDLLALLSMSALHWLVIYHY